MGATSILSRPLPCPPGESGGRSAGGGDGLPSQIVASTTAQLKLGRNIPIDIPPSLGQNST